MAKARSLIEEEGAAVIYTRRSLPGLQKIIRPKAMMSVVVRSAKEHAED